MEIGKNDRYPGPDNDRYPGPILISKTWSTPKSFEVDPDICWTPKNYDQILPGPMRALGLFKNFLLFFHFSNFIFTRHTHDVILKT